LEQAAQAVQHHKTTQEEVVRHHHLLVQPTVAVQVAELTREARTVVAAAARHEAQEQMLAQVFQVKATTAVRVRRKQAVVVVVRQP